MIGGMSGEGRRPRSAQLEGFKHSSYLWYSLNEEREYFSFFVSQSAIIEFGSSEGTPLQSHQWHHLQSCVVFSAHETTWRWWWWWLWLWRWWWCWGVWRRKQYVHNWANEAYHAHSLCICHFLQDFSFFDFFEALRHSSHANNRLVHQLSPPSELIGAVQREPASLWSRPVIRSVDADRPRLVYTPLICTLSPSFSPPHLLSQHAPLLQSGPSLSPSRFFSSQKVLRRPTCLLSRLRLRWRCDLTPD